MEYNGLHSNTRAIASRWNILSDAMWSLSTWIHSAQNSRPRTAFTPELAAAKTSTEAIVWYTRRSVTQSVGLSQN
jgi:hypothetical protein